MSQCWRTNVSPISSHFGAPVIDAHKPASGRPIRAHNMNQFQRIHDGHFRVSLAPKSGYKLASLSHPLPGVPYQRASRCWRRKLQKVPPSIPRARAINHCRNGGHYDSQPTNLFRRCAPKPRSEELSFSRGADVLSKTLFEKNGRA